MSWGSRVIRRRRRSIPAEPRGTHVAPAGFMRTLRLFAFLSAITACGGGSGSDASKASPADGGTSSTAPAPSSDASATDAGGDGDAGTSLPVDGPAAGTVGGHAFAYAHGIAIPKSVGGAAGYEILLSDSPIDCANATLESSKTLDVGVAGQPPATKTYSVVDALSGTAGANDVYADFNVLDATCGSVLSNSSKVGTLVLTKFDATNVEGSIDIEFQSNAGAAAGKVAGTFTAVVCPKFPAITCTPH
jgi:hypothetical protein